MELVDRDADQRMRWSRQRPIRVAIDGPWVKWDYIYDDGPFGPGEPEAGFGFPPIPVAPPMIEGRLALTQFLNLADKSSEGVRRFVEQWGPLTLCRHGLPMTHPPIESDPAARAGVFCPQVDGDGLWGREPLDKIRGWARLGRATLKIGLAITSDERSLGNLRDWAALGVNAPRDRRQAVETLTAALNAWLILGLVWGWVDLARAPRFHLTAHGVFGAIAQQLVFAVMNSTVAICTSCGEAYQPSRRPRPGQDSYCSEPDCKSASRREASRRSRGRRRQVE